MPRRYRHILQYKKEIIEMRNDGKCLRELAEVLGFTHNKMNEFKSSQEKREGHRRGATPQ